MSLSFSSPLSLYSIPVVWFIGFYPHFLKTRLFRKTIGWNNVQPRGNTSRLSDKVPPEIAARIARLEGANQNGNETYPLYAVAILAGNYAKIDNQTLNIFAASYIALRVLYNTIYANQTTELHAGIRGIVWATGIFVPSYLIIKAGNILREAA